MRVLFLAAFFALPTLTHARAIVARGIDEEQVRAALASAESEVRACIHEARPERDAQVRVRLDWRPQRRTGMATMRINAPTARACIQTKLEAALNGLLRRRAMPTTLRVSHLYRIAARTTVEPAPTFDDETVNRTMRRANRRLITCMGPSAPGVPGRLTMRAYRSTRVGDCSSSACPVWTGWMGPRLCRAASTAWYPARAWWGGRPRTRSWSSIPSSSGSGRTSAGASSDRGIFDALLNGDSVLG